MKVKHYFSLVDFNQKRRKLFLLVFLWTCLCLVIFRSSLFASSPLRLRRTQAHDDDDWPPPEPSLRPAAWSSRAPDLGQTAFGLAAPESSERQQPADTSAIPSPSSFSSSAPPPAASSQRRRRPQAQVSPAESAGGQSQPTSQNPSLRHANEPLVAGAQCQYNYPSLYDLQFNNIHWQKFVSKTFSPPLAVPPPSSNNSSSSSTDAKTPVSTYYLYNAYYDDRWRGGLPSVRILAMIDRIHPPPTNCLLWSNKLRDANERQQPIVTRASFVYAWYPKWGNYKDGILQPWIVTCPVPRAHSGTVPDSISLVEVPPELEQPTDLGSYQLDFEIGRRRRRRDTLEAPQQQQASIAMPPAFSSSSLSPSAAGQSNGAHLGSTSAYQQPGGSTISKPTIEYDCERISPITNNLPVYNQRPSEKKKFAVCVKGLDFPHEDVSTRLVEWIEMMNLLGAGKIFLYDLDVHENISKVLHYYQERGIVELSPLTLPGDQPNLPEYQHLYLKNRLTAKRQNELIPYNDCLYRNLNSYQYLALLDIDEIIMPLEHHNWYDLMQEVEHLSLAEQNYSRASYNVRNVYFFDDLAGPLGTTSTSSSSSSSTSSSKSEPSSDQDAGHNNQQVALERGIPNYLHMMQHVYRSKNYTEPGQYVKCFHNTERVVSLHNHFPMNCFGQCTTYSIPTRLAHLQHYRKDCVGPLKQSCKNDFRAFTMRDTTIWKYKQQMIKRTTRVLNYLSRQNSKPKSQPREPQQVSQPQQAFAR